MKFLRFWILALVIMNLAYTPMFAARKKKAETMAKPVVEWKHLDHVVVLSPAMDEPEFLVSYTNETGQRVDIIELIKDSVIILDDKEHKLKSIKFGGDPDLQPGKTWSYKVSISAYAQTMKKKKKSKILGRRRWKSKLSSGTHTLVIRFAGGQTNPIRFNWDGKTPLLYK